ncbi:MAG: hypothetical protein H6622_11515 [Halobacteriovoraceae bacterium]|nr:hypothetical protein [Halobacteriovoraceae bacterium]
MIFSKLVYIGLLSVYLTPLVATPKNVEVWFLSEVAVGKSSLQNILNPKIDFSEYLVIDESKCVQMGDGCFHPQLGFVPKEELNEKKENEKISNPTEIKTINALETNLINCDKNYHFDIFCGEASKDKNIANADTQIWFDNSSSFNVIDYSKEANFCHRRLVAQKIKNVCKDKVSFYTYNTHKILINDLSPICTHHGTNSTKSLIQWIKLSQVKNLYVVTDIAEMNMELSAYLDSIGAKTHGLGTMARNVNNLEDFVTNVNKLCQ